MQIHVQYIFTVICTCAFFQIAIKSQSYLLAQIAGTGIHSVAANRALKPRFATT
jgi:hypothetical protein